MLQTRTSTRTFDSAPPSTSSFVAALLEPLLTIVCYLGLAALHD